MEAKETVMSEEIMESIIFRTATQGIPTQRGYGGALVKAQAEISFKAGIKEGIEYVVSGKYMECENLKELSSD